MVNLRRMQRGRNQDTFGTLSVLRNTVLTDTGAGVGWKKRSSKMSQVRRSEIQDGERRTFLGVIFRLLVGGSQLLKRAEHNKSRASSGANRESRLRFMADRNEVCVELFDIYIYRGTRSSRPLG